jgi:hypothetical protein
VKRAIVGSRGYPDPDQVRDYVRSLPVGTEVVTGGNDGTSGEVDEIAAEEARACGLSVVIFWPQTDVYGPRQGPRQRNEQIVAYCDDLVAFWGQVESPGTSHIVGLANRAGKLLRVERPRLRA